jgi:hypothetical protein
MARSGFNTLGQHWAERASDDEIILLGAAPELAEIKTPDVVEARPLKEGRRF